MENGAESTIINQSETVSVEKIIEDRFSQIKADRLSEYVTGLRLDDPKLLDRLQEDQLAVRAKYKLLDRDYKFVNPSEYEEYLTELARSNDIEIRPVIEYEKFFAKQNISRATYLEEERTVVNSVDKTTRETYLRGIIQLEHELIHGLQHKYYPEMPIELTEYEAYVASWNIDYLRDHQENLKTVFNVGLTYSVFADYGDKSEKAGRKIEPVWDNPEYFLKNVDGVGEGAVQKYKIEHQIDIEK